MECTQRNGIITGYIIILMAIQTKLLQMQKCLWLLLSVDLVYTQ